MTLADALWALLVCGGVGVAMGWFASHAGELPGLVSSLLRLMGFGR